MVAVMSSSSRACRIAARRPAASIAAKARSARPSQLANFGVRCEATPQPTPATAPTPEMPTMPLAEPIPAFAEPAPAAAAPFSILGEAQEMINARAAMLGFVIAVTAELHTNQSTWSQLAGKYVDGTLVEKPIGMSTLLYGFVIVFMSLATFAPIVNNNETVGSRSAGPFTPGLEKTVGRTAMLGFAGLLVVELLKGNTPVF